MKQTNYQLFDFLDFDIDLNGGDRLWRACTPTGIEEKCGDVYVTVPFRKQNNSNEITPDNQVPPKNYKIRLRAYGEKILRVSVAFEGEICNNSEMLQTDSVLQQSPLYFEKSTDEWVIRDSAGRKKPFLICVNPIQIGGVIYSRALPSQSMSVSFPTEKKK